MGYNWDQYGAGWYEECWARPRVVGKSIGEVVWGVVDTAFLELLLLVAGGLDGFLVVAMCAQSRLLGPEGLHGISDWHPGLGIDLLHLLL